MLWRCGVFIAVCLHTTVVVQTAKQQVQLSDSYLPVAMQIIAHLTDQMAFEVKDEPTQPPKPTLSPSNNWTKPPSKPLNDGNWQKPTTKPTPTKPTNSWTKPTNSWNKPTNSWNKPTSSWNKPTTSWNKPVTSKPQATTPYHRPGLFAPASPPKPSDRIHPKTYVLLPIDYNTQYTVIEPLEKKTEEPFLSIQDEEVKPLIEPAKDPHLLPPHFEADKVSRSDDEFSEENLQYLSENVRELIKMAHDPKDERVVDVWEGVRAGSHEVSPKGKLSSSNLRLLLLYDLLSREAKRLRLSDYSGFSPDVMKNLVESSSGGARAQLSMALSKMVERRDCEHEYANNRAKEMVVELAKDESKLSSELRYLQPLVYKF